MQSVAETVGEQPTRHPTDTNLCRTLLEIVMNLKDYKLLFFVCFFIEPLQQRKEPVSFPSMALCSAPFHFISRLFFETIQKLLLTLSVSVFSLAAVLAPSSFPHHSHTHCLLSCHPLMHLALVWP